MSAPNPFEQGRDGFADAGDGIRLYYRTSGSGPTLVVVHGGPGMDHASLFADLAPLARTHRLVFYDQRGGGRSTLPADTSRLRIEDHVQDLEALRRHLGLERVSLLAHSFGPALAALYAIAHPERVERMVFIGPIPPHRGSFLESYEANLRSRLSPDALSRMEALDKLWATAADPAAVCREYWSLGVPPRLARGVAPSVLKSDFCTAPPEAIRYGMAHTSNITFASLGDWDWTPKLRALRVPTLVVHGEEEAIPMDQAREWAVVMPEARLLRVPGAAHFPHAERPELVFPAIETFLGGAWPAATKAERAP